MKFAGAVVCFLAVACSSLAQEPQAEAVPVAEKDDLKAAGSSYGGYAGNYGYSPYGSGQSAALLGGLGYGGLGYGGYGGLGYGGVGYGSGLGYGGYSGLGYGGYSSGYGGVGYGSGLGYGGYSGLGYGGYGGLGYGYGSGLGSGLGSSYGYGSGLLSRGLYNSYSGLYK